MFVWIFIHNFDRVVAVRRLTGPVVSRESAVLRNRSLHEIVDDVIRYAYSGHWFFDSPISLKRTND